MVKDKTIQAFDKLTKLRTLKICSNISVINADISTLTNLETLYLFGPSRITDINTLTKLKTLNLNCNSSVTDNGISNLINLVSLDIYGASKITTGGLSNFVNLTINGK